MPIKIKDPDKKKTLKYIEEYFDYSEEHKGFIYKKKGPGRSIGVLAGIGPHKIYGYIATRVNGRVCRVHRLIFLYFNKKWPKGELDHINGNNSDNRIENLRECSRSENCANRKMWSKKYKFKGVAFWQDKKKWCAYITENKKQRDIGFFNTEIEAARAYDREAKQAFGKFAYLNFKDKDNENKST